MWATGDPDHVNYDVSREMELPELPMPVPIFDLYSMFTRCLREKVPGPNEAALAKDTAAIMGKWVISTMVKMPIAGTLKL